MEDQVAGPSSSAHSIGSSSSSSSAAALSLKYLEQARSLCFDEHNYGSAVSLYLLSARTHPSSRAVMKQELLVAVQEFVEELRAAGETEKVFQVYRSVCEVCPENDLILNHLGSFLYSIGYVDEAASYFLQALKVDPTNDLSCENLEAVFSSLIGRWHYKMINDEQRNLCYQGAIQGAISEGYHSVLDVGTGSGLLSMIAVRCGAKCVSACEHSKAMFDIACSIVSENNMSKNINIVHSSSHDLNIPQHEKPTVMVTEIFDSALFGEHIIPTVRDAWARLLKPGDGESRVIPAAADVYASVIDCPYIRQQTCFIGNRFGSLSLEGVDIVGATGSGTTSSDPYTTLDMHRVNGGYTMLTDSISVVSVDFNRPETLRDDVIGGLMELRFEIVRPGTADALAVWFDLHLDSTITLSTSPTSTPCCWEQAIFPLSKNTYAGTCRGEINIMVAGSYLNVVLQLTENSTCLKLLSWSKLTGGEKTPSSENIEGNRNPTVDAVPSKPDPNDAGSSRLVVERSSAVCSDEDVRKLNDRCHTFTTLRDVHTCSLKRCANDGLNFDRVLPDDAGDALTIVSDLADAFSFRSRDVGSTRPLAVVDMTRSFPLISLHLLKAGLASHVLLIDQPDSLRNAVRRVCRENGMADDDVLSWGDARFDKVNTRGATFDMIIADVIEPSGRLRPGALEEITLAKAFVLDLDGIVIPSRLGVHAVCIQSAELQEVSSIVSDDRTLGFKVADTMNEFTMSTHQDIDMSSLVHTKLTSPVELFHIDLNDSSDITCDSDGQMESCTERHNSHIIRVIETGYVTAVPYWFTIDDSNTSTAESSNHWNVAAVLLKRPLHVETGDTLTLTADLKNSCISLSVALDAKK